MQEAWENTKCMEYFSQKTWREETIWEMKAKTLVADFCKMVMNLQKAGNFLLSLVTSSFLKHSAGWS